MIRRLVTTYLALTLVVLAALEIPLAVTYRDRQLDQLEAGLERDAFVISSYVEGTLSGYDNQDLQVIVDNYSAGTDGRAVVVDANGDKLADSDPPVADAQRNFMSRPEIAAALNDRQIVSGTRDSTTLGTGLVYVAIPIASGNRVLGAVRITYSTNQLDARVHRYWALLAAAAAVTLAVAGGLGILLARWVTRPIADLRDAAMQIGDGDLEARADQNSGPPEVRDLAEAFNTTALRLEQLVTAQEHFVADASHQLRTPLTALRLRLEMLQDENGPDAAEDLDAARSEVQRLSRLVDGLLELARAERATGAAPPRRSSWPQSSRIGPTRGARSPTSGMSCSRPTPGRTGDGPPRTTSDRLSTTWWPMRWRWRRRAPPSACGSRPDRATARSRST